jgi:tellurite methyltransferase
MSSIDRDKWNAKYAAGEVGGSEPSLVLAALDRWLPRRGRALDVAGGAGRNALWLAKRGLDVTLADVSSAGLAIARQRAAEQNLPLATLETDLEDQPFPPGPWDLIVSVCYLWRPLFAVYPAVLARGGTLVVIEPTTENLSRHPKPPAQFLLQPGELRLLAAGLEIVHYAEGWQADGRHDACLVATRP